MSSPTAVHSPDSTGSSTQEWAEGSDLWWAAHLFLDPPGEPRADAMSRARVDQLLQDLVAPSVDTLTRQFSIRRSFFIRYNELGAHVRLRLLLPQSGRDAKAIARRLDQLLGAGAVARDHYGAWVPCRHELLNHRRFVPYEPELERYGGLSGVALAEEVFHHSSQLVLQLLAAPVEESLRSAKAVLAMVVLLHGLADDRPHAARLADAYSRLSLTLSRSTNPGLAALSDVDSLHATFKSSWQRQSSLLAPKVEGLWSCLAAGDEIPEPWARFRDGVSSCRRRLDSLVSNGDLMFAGRAGPDRSEAVDRLLPSYLHMGNNRLGVYVFEEAYLGYLTARLLAPADAPSLQPPKLGD